MGRKKGTTKHTQRITNFPFWRECKIGEHTVSFFTGTARPERPVKCLISSNRFWTKIQFSVFILVFRDYSFFRQMNFQCLELSTLVHFFDIILQLFFFFKKWYQIMIYFIKFEFGRVTVLRPTASGTWMEFNVY